MEKNVSGRGLSRNTRGDVARAGNSLSRNCVEVQIGTQDPLSRVNPDVLGSERFVEGVSSARGGLRSEPETHHSVTPPSLVQALAFGSSSAQRTQALERVEEARRSAENLCSRDRERGQTVAVEVSPFLARDSQTDFVGHFETS